MKSIPEIFASQVFNESVMKERLPKDTYKSLKQTIASGKPLDISIANVVANAMKAWAIEKGATHFTHWFQPLTGITAEKHDSFIAPTDDGKVIMEFSGKELIKGEPDASSFPSGGLRATFEARGYTAWDPTSYAFVKDGSLYVPTAFCSYGGEALDKKTPLLRSMDVLSEQAIRILKLFGTSNVKRVISTVGPEQEYFLIDKEIFEKRPDLIYCGRTLFGSRPSKGQELEDHYFGAIKPRVSAFMKDLDEELWKLGILAKTKHNEVAPAQHELAPIFSSTNTATDHNQLTMEIMKTTAQKHDMVCLLHEKPFAGVNGSGKHVNWSMSTDTGMNLLEPTDTPSQNAQFLLFLTAVIKAVNEHQDLLRISVASAGNDHRLGANEAPPAIISMFLGDELSDILKDIMDGACHTDKKKSRMDIGSVVLPTLPKDSTDRNRTSPFAFTGNKFEFRMPGSSFSVAGPAIILNTIVADILRDFADVLENSKDFKNDLAKLIKTTLQENERIIFNGNNYSNDWVVEAKKRGLLNLKSTVEALPYFISQSNIDLFERNQVFSKTEILSRYEILLENYSKVIRIEALTFVDLVKQKIIPAVVNYQGKLAIVCKDKKSINPSIATLLEEKLLSSISTISTSLYNGLTALEDELVSAVSISDELKLAVFYHDTILTKMNELRLSVDELETITASDYWPFPSYGEILYSVK